MRTGLTNLLETESPQRADGFRSRNIPWKFHPKARIGSSIK